MFEEGEGPSDDVIALSYFAKAMSTMLDNVKGKIVRVIIVEALL